MGGVAAIVHFDGRPVADSDLASMCERAAHRGRDGTGVWIDGTVGLGRLAHRVRSSEAAVVDPTVAADLAASVDARLDNRGDLIRRLRLADDADDATIVLEAYRRFGDRFGAELLGDFAVVVWDRRRRRIVLTRDPMGVRPLYFRHEPGRRVLVGSEVGQILAVTHESVGVDETQLAAFLHGPVGMRDRSFHEEVHQVEAGTAVAIAAGGGPVRIRCWTPDVEPRSGADPRELAEGLREVLLEATRSRCDGIVPTSMLLSGGADSGSAALAAGELARGGGIVAPRTFTWAFDELRSCDERDVSSVVAAAAGLVNHGIPADDAYPLADHPGGGPPLDSPAAWPWADLTRRTYAHLAAEGASVVMVSGRGDEVVGDAVWDYAGLLRSGRVSGLLPRLSGDAATAIPPWRAARSALRRELRRPPADVPPPLGPRLAGLVEPRALWREEVRRTRVVPGRGRQIRFGRIFGYAAQQITSLEEREAARAGLVLVDPFTDRRVIEYVLSLPQHEVTRPDRPKDLLLRAVRPWMPDGVGFRSADGLGALVDRGLLDRRRVVVEDLVARSELVARGYARPGAYAVLYSGVVGGARTAALEWGIAAELWLRRHWPATRSA